MTTESHRSLCTIGLIGDGHADRCPGKDCPFWEHRCVLSRIESDLDSRPEVAALLLN